MMRNRPVSLIACAIALCAVASTAAAQTTPGAKPAEQVIEPSVPRRDITVPKIPSNDILIGGYLGTYSSEDFGASFVYGARLGYHITEDFFVEGVYGTTKVSDENYRQILPGGIFPDREETLDYYNLSIGYNVLPGEAFVGRSYAFAQALYLIAGVGSTRFIEQSSQTISFGVGYRVMFKDWASIQLDFRDHMYSIDLLGQDKSTHNLEFTVGATFFF